MIGRPLNTRLRLALGSALTIAALTMHVSPANAYWCANYRTGGTNCGFSTFSQCMESVSGAGGNCNEIRESAPAARPERAPRSVAEPPRRAPPPRQAAPVAAPAMIPAAPAPAMPAAPPAQAALAQPQMSAAFVQARGLILGGQHEAGLAAMRSLNADGHPDVAAYAGLATARLGRTGESQAWYERALAADPNHRLALSFQGMLRAEQNDIPGAQANLVRIGRLCGNTNCNEYQALQAVIAGKIR
jgi:Protein of unknown function (DUF3551)